MKVPCAQCPFRSDSTFCYDSDAYEALDDGDAPACHMQVGVDLIFAHSPMNPPEGCECAGYEAWLCKKRGFAAPARARVAAPVQEEAAIHQGDQ